MDRQTVYPGQVPLETDLLNTNRNVLIGLGKMAGAMIGLGTFVNGLACTPTGPASLSVLVAPGEIYSLQNLDGTAYSSLPADITHSLVKQGILLDAFTLACAAPATAGYSINYLIEATYQDIDATAVALPYYNASNPTQAYTGPANSGAAQSTVRKGSVVLQAKAGIAATTGTQTTPSADAGNVGLWVVTVANGQATITAPNIVQAAGAPFIGAPLTAKANATDLALSTGSGLVGFNSTTAYSAGTVGFELNKAKTVYGTGVAATDVANLQAAINAAADYTTIALFGAFVFNAKITVKPKLKLVGNYATISFTNNAVNLFDYSPGAPTGYPGRIIFDRLTINGPGNSGSSVAINIDANAPFVMVFDCFITNVFKAIYLRDCYSSTVINTSIDTASHGIQLYRESHAIHLQNNFVNNCTVAALSINYGGGAGTGVTHNVNVIGGAYQNSAVGIWAEQTQGLHTVGLYHEGNTVNDYRLGVADAGVYARACYNTIIDGFESASACAGGKNVQIEHAVSLQVRGAAWNSGCSTTATLLSYDGFSDRVTADVHRYTTTAPTATAPVDFTADATRGVLWYRGRQMFPVGQTDSIQFGTLAAVSGSVSYQQPAGRNSLILSSILDIILKIKSAAGVFRVQDDTGVDKVVVDLVNNKLVITPVSIQVPNMPSTNPGAGSKVIWYDPTDLNRVKFAP